MTEHLGLFESLAADDSDSRIARRKALAVANRRVQERFGAFLAAANSLNERTARLDFVRSDLREIVAAVCNEYGGDPETVETSVLRYLAVGPLGPGAPAPDPSGFDPNDLGEAFGDDVDDPYAGQSEIVEPDWDGVRAWVQQLERTDPDAAQGIKDAMGSEAPPAGPLPGTNEYENPDAGPYALPGSYPQNDEEGRVASVKTARRPKLCPYHSEVTDISLATGDPAAGFNTMAQHAWGPQHCQSEGYEGRCNFKREMVTQKFWDERAQQADERREERERQREIQQEQEQTVVPDDISTLEDTEPIPAEEGIDTELAEAPSAVGEGESSEPMLEPMAASMQKEAIPPVPINFNPQVPPDSPPAPPTPPPPGIPGAPGTGLGAGRGLSPAQGLGAPGTVPSTPNSQPPLADQDPGIAAGPSPAQQSAQGLRQRVDVNPDFDPNQHQYNVEHFKNRQLKNPRGPGVASVKEGEALETVDVTKGSPNDPSPEMNKDKIPEKGQEDVDAEMEGSPNPTETVDPLKPIVPENNEADFLDGTDAVTEHQDVDQESSFDGNKADSGSWKGNNGASPVAKVEAGKVDPDINPIRQILEEGFVPPTHVEAAIKEWDEKHPS